MSQKNQAKTNQNGKKYLEYSEMSKEDLIAMLRRVHARIKRVSASLREMENEVEALRQLLLYGSSNSSPGTSTGYTRGKSYGGRVGYKGRTGGYGKYKRAGKKPAQAGEEVGEEEEPVEVGEEVEEEEPKEAGKKPEPKPEAKAEAKPEKGGS
jgi:hypothetical protein